ALCAPAPTGRPSPASPGGRLIKRRSVLQDADARSPAVAALLDLHGRQFAAAFSDRVAGVGHDRSLRSQVGGAAPLYLLLGIALHVAEPGVARAHRGTRTYSS